MSQHNDAIRVQRSMFFVVVLIAFVASSAIAEAAEEIRCLRDVAYKTDGETQYERDRCKLDLYLPADGEGFATIVWFHGGGIQAGDKAGKIAVTFGRRFAGEGIAVASVNYRLHPKVDLEVEGRNHGSVASRVGDSDDVVAKSMVAFIERLRP
jgi:acetyl esterase/lipase